MLYLFYNEKIPNSKQAFKPIVNMNSLSLTIDSDSFIRIHVQVRLSHFQFICTTFHRYPILSTRYSVMCKVYTGYCGTSEIEHGLCACTVDNPLAKARGLSLRTGAQTMLYLPLVVVVTRRTVLMEKLVIYPFLFVGGYFSK